MIFINPLKKFFTGNWINKGFGWVIKYMDGKYVNISIRSPLSGRTYIKLFHKLKNSMEGLTYIKNNDNKCFLWCNIRHLNLLKMHLEKITKAHKKWLIILIIKILNFFSLKRLQ